jgi:4-aminobutyrate aminotransferase-like enzyme
MAGFGRTGQWLALDAFDVRPVDNRIHVAPPAVVTPAEIERGLDLIDQALTALSS